MTIVAFDAAQATRAKLFLATKVAEMMGRKFEEEDWAQVYCAAKDIPLATWSNLDIDIMHGPLGVEQKMMCWTGKGSILKLVGTPMMHPSSTRAVRFPRGEDDATRAAHDILRQYGELIDRRSAIVRAVNAYRHGVTARDRAFATLIDMGMSRPKATAMLPVAGATLPRGDYVDRVDMRIGWLVWRRSLDEFLYFEEAMAKPDPRHFVAEWKDRKAGRRGGSRNLWVTDIRTDTKTYSITGEEAGVKIQPYFTVPMRDDPALFHFRVQGEDAEGSTIRTWVTPATVRQLQARLDAVDAATLANAIARVTFPERPPEDAQTIFPEPAEEVILPRAAYDRLVAGTAGVSDEHRFRILAGLLEP